VTAIFITAETGISQFGLVVFGAENQAFLDEKKSYHTAL
jgi:hypothetical protein